MDNVEVIRVISGLMFLAIPLIAAVLVANDANKRGMNGIGWGIGTFFLCIVFLPLYLILRNPAAVPGIQANNTSIQTGPRLCPSCGKYHEGRPPFCPMCGAPQQNG
jgi:xanthine/uracil/vitamin C permease (AzgA family)